MLCLGFELGAAQDGRRRRIHWAMAILLHLPSPCWFHCQRKISRLQLQDLIWDLFKIPRTFKRQNKNNDNNEDEEKNFLFLYFLRGSKQQMMKADERRIEVIFRLKLKARLENKC